MSYIAFIDMIGTRASAMISNEEYTDAIDDFNNSLTQLCASFECTIYGYSDNAYIEVKKLVDMIGFFRVLRDNLMNKHRYFSAVVDKGSLCAGRVPLRKGFSMKFTSPATVDIYKKQCQFTGIGVSLTENVVSDMNDKKLENAFCQSIFQQRPNSKCEPVYTPVFDLAYDRVSLDKIEYIIADYLMTAASDERAGRYYLTPVISMVKSLNKNTISSNLNELVGLLGLQAIPGSFKVLHSNCNYSKLFIFALVDYVFSLRERDKSIDATRLCEQIISGYQVDFSELVQLLPTIPTAVISDLNKRRFLNVIYNAEVNDTIQQEEGK